MARYSVHEASARLEEILQKVRAGEKAVLTEDGKDIVEIQPIQQAARTGDPVEDALRELEEEGILSPPGAKPEGEIVPVAVQPGALARFLASRD
jgi:antitoxin (DNA-binding transcriptional repressor) of toxin-antitoxin stability system